MGVSYFNGPVDPDDYDEGYVEGSSRKSRFKINLAIFLVVLAGLSTTFAANISLNGGQRKEFGQGIFQIKACDQWVGIGLQSAAQPNNAYVGTIKLYGFDPRLCVGRIFKIQLFKTGSTTPLPLYIGPGATSGTDTHTSLSLMDTSTPLASSGYQSSINPTRSAYENWAYDAVTIVDKWGRNVGYDDGYAYIDYKYDTGQYWIVFTYPRAIVAEVTSVTIESAKYN
jgi:hypothetical protein